MAPQQLAGNDATGAHMMLTSAFTVSKAQLDLPSQVSCFTKGLSLGQSL